MMITLEETEEGLRWRQWRCGDCVGDFVLPSISKKTLRALIADSVDKRPLPDGVTIRTDPRTVYVTVDGTKVYASWPHLFVALA